MMTPVDITYDYDNPEIVVTTIEDLGRVLVDVRVRSQSYPVMAMVTIVGRPFAQILEFGIHDDRGWLHFIAGADAWWSHNNGGASGTVAYDYQGESHDIPASAEIAYDAVQTAIINYMTSNGCQRPTNVEWTEDD